MKESASVCEAYFHKRNVFSHEGEYRVIFYEKALLNVINSLEVNGASNNLVKKISKMEDFCESEIINLIEGEIEKMIIPHEKPVKKELYIEIHDLKKYIKSVMTNPFIEDWIDVLIKNVCLRNGLNYIGKSRMYTM